MFYSHFEALRRCDHPRAGPVFLLQEPPRRKSPGRRFSFHPEESDLLHCWKIWLWKEHIGSSTLWSLPPRQWQDHLRPEQEPPARLRGREVVAREGPIAARSLRSGRTVVHYPLLRHYWREYCVWKCESLTNLFPLVLIFLRSSTPTKKR